MAAHWTLVDVLALMPAIETETVRREAEEFYQPRRLGEHMVRRGVLTDEQLEIALVRQRVLNGATTPDDAHRLEALQDRSRAKRIEAVALLGDAAGAWQ